MRSSRIARIAAAAALVVLGALVFPSTATAAPLGTVTLSQQTGSVTDNPMFATGTTSAPCPATFGEEAALRIGPADTGPFTNLAPSQGGGGFDQAAVVDHPTRSFATALGQAPGDGRYWIVVECFSLTEGRHPDRFVTEITVAGGTWTVAEGSTGTPTTTTLAVTPASPQPAGTEVTLTATVAPAGAAGTVQFRRGDTALGSPVAVAGGTATLAVADLPAGTHLLAAAFTPADQEAFAGSVSAAQQYQITGGGGGNPVATTTTLGVSPESPQPAGTTITFTATVTPSSAVGTVQFRSDSDVIGTETLTGGTATLQASRSGAGTVSLTAVFVPADATAYAGSTSAAVTYEITAAGPTPSASEPTPAPPAGSLPVTGNNVQSIALLGAGLATAGVAVLWASRRRPGTGGRGGGGRDATGGPHA